MFEERVLSEVEHIPDPVERLKTCMAKNIRLVTRGVEQGSHHHPPRARHAHRKPQAQINARKKRYVRFLESSFAEAVDRQLYPSRGPDRRRVRLPGDGSWIYKWFKPGGKRTDDDIAADMVDLLFTGLVPAPRS